MRSEFIYQPGPYPQCHASTIAETAAGHLVAAWFGGTAESAPDVCIHLSLFDGARWTPSRQVADGLQVDRARLPTWNPVLFQPRSGPLHLFYKVGASPESWWGMVMRSSDGGETWSRPERLPNRILGPIKNKPVELADGTWISPSSTEHPLRGWHVHVERSTDQGSTWNRISSLVDPAGIDAIQPAVLVHRDGRLQLVGRTRQKVMASAWSEDGGLTWSPLAATELRIANSGLDALTLDDGLHVVACNPRDPEGAPPNPRYRALGALRPTTPADTTEDWGVRWPLVLAVSREGVDWQPAVVLEREPRLHGYAYPAVIQARDGAVHVTYTWDRTRIKHVILDPAELRATPPAALEARR